MAYGGGPKDSLAQLMRKNDRKPMNNAHKNNKSTCHSKKLLPYIKKFGTIVRT